MLARLSIVLDAEDVDYHKSSLLQGVLLERLDSKYVNFLHHQQMHPYSQYVQRTETGMVWHIQTLNKEAYEQIIVPFAEGDNFFEIKHTGKMVSMVRKEIEMVKKEQLMADFYNEAAVHSLTFEVVTPMAFKQGGHYAILPDVRLICQNLMQRYSAVSGNIDMMDREALEQITDKVFVARHRICSRLFPLEGHNLPGFCGSVTLRCQGTETMARYLRLLLSFGEFSGVGIKTAMGMGAMRIRRDKR